MASRWALMVAFSLLCASVVGCGSGGPELGTVKGLVTLDGQPLPNALVTFSPEKGGGSSTAVTDASGNYSLIYRDKDGAELGMHKVSVSIIPQAAAAPKEMSSDDPAYQQQQLGTGSTAAEAPATKIPDRYSAAKTELKKEVKPGENVHNLELTST